MKLWISEIFYSFRWHFQKNVESVSEKSVSHAIDEWKNVSKAENLGNAPLFEFAAFSLGTPMTSLKFIWGPLKIIPVSIFLGRKCVLRRV